ncbi:MAG TPA: alpha-1,4-glucan--maltose-1-phosphate maltosyltransferase [Acidimicrobiia bacterium]|nr:alpha-1,4-glucan--maltose-1-phosphate maltosyltransferase [Acidimicrobiia bacterium]
MTSEVPVSTRVPETTDELHEPAIATPDARGPRTPPPRVVIEDVRPQVDGGQFAAKAIAGDDVEVWATVFADGHDELRARVRHRRPGETRWREVEMEPLGNDRWHARVPVAGVGRYELTVTGWIDAARTWRRDLGKRFDAGQDVALDLAAGALLAEAAAGRCRGADGDTLRGWAKDLRDRSALDDPCELDELVALLERHPDRTQATELDHRLPLVADRERAGFSAWYELFPRSASPDPDRAGTLADVTARLDYVAELGFDVLYLPPIHPIGETNRKGRNNTELGEAGDVGSPWAIGSAAGGHTAIDPRLGTFEDFDRLVARAGDLGMEVALDLAFQCSPDHPWVREHPQWFRHRPDGSIAYAENPPKRYQDIYPVDFESADWPALWQALRDVVTFWIERGVQVFRVDNPHTKPFAFWQWLITTVKADHPGVIFLSEAFTRPAVMHRLAKLGFTQSYTYFTWRNARWEIEEYFTELTAPPGNEYFRPNVWPNTPDILHEYLQHGGRAAFTIRLLLAACLGANYGIYGPAFELMEHVPREPGSEEYLHSEKYEVRNWDLDRPDSLRWLIARVNAVRRAHRALQRDRNLRFHPTDNDAFVCWSKRTDACDDVVLGIVSVDPHNRQSGWVHLDMPALGLDWEEPFEVHDLLTDAHYRWNGPHNFVALDPGSVPAHVFEVRRITATAPTDGAR